MGHCVAPFPLHSPTNIRFLCHPNCKFSSYPSIFRQPNSRLFSVSASIGQQDLRFSWTPSKQSSNDEYNGWAVVEAPVSELKKKKGGALLIFIIGSSVAVLLGVIGCTSVSRKGFRWRFNDLNSDLRGNLLTSKTEEGAESEAVDADKLKERVDVSEGSLVDSATNTVHENVKIAYVGVAAMGHFVLHFSGNHDDNETEHCLSKPSRPARIILPVAVDPTQQEALSMLQTLKIIEDDIKANEFCTRREYARWLIQANRKLERSRKHKIVLSAALSGSIIAAFDDVSVEDPDFEHIQTLAEAGILRSKLSGNSVVSDLNQMHTQEGFNFFPDRFISREGLISWKAKLEYEVLSGVDEEISRRDIGFLDVREISPESLVDLYADALADGRSILRKVFGQGKRFQPKKPCTKAQAAVALTSGRMAEILSAELSRIEAENTSRHIAMEEIRSELIERGDIRRSWDRKIEEERLRSLKAEEDYRAALDDLERGKVVLGNSAAEFSKQKAALDCQMQLLSSLKEKINQMAETLSLEKANYTDDSSNLKALVSDLQAKYDKLLDTKAVLEAEIEALRILRSWVGDEAMKSRARTKVLEEVEQRWKWYKEL